MPKTDESTFLKIVATLFAFYICIIYLFLCTISFGQVKTPLKHGSVYVKVEEGLLTHQLQKNGYIEVNTDSKTSRVFRLNNEYILFCYTNCVLNNFIVHKSYENITWKELKSLYYQEMNQISQVYGKPINTKKGFEPPFKEGDGNELTAVLVECCNYATAWEAEDGTILLMIDKFQNQPSILKYYFL